jgi:hypothetical protein
MELDAAADDDDERVSGADDTQPQAGEMVEDHPAGGPDLLVAGMEPGHLLAAPEGPADLALDQAEHEQGQADHPSPVQRPSVVLHEDGSERI